MEKDVFPAGENHRQHDCQKQARGQLRLAFRIQQCVGRRNACACDRSRSEAAWVGGRDTLGTLGCSCVVVVVCFVDALTGLARWPGRWMLADGASVQTDVISQARVLTEHPRRKG